MWDKGFWKNKIESYHETIGNGYVLCYAHFFFFWGGLSGRIIFAHVDICAGQCCGAVVVRVPKIFPVFSGGGGGKRNATSYMCVFGAMVLFWVIYVKSRVR